MTRKSSKAKPPATVTGPWQSATYPRRQFEAHQGATDAETAQNFIGAVLSPAAAAARVVLAAERGTGQADALDVPSLVACLQADAQAASRGDLTGAEAMLAGQASALQALFVRLVERGMGCTHAPAFEVNLKFALMAQRQSAKALETLALVKAGPPVFARQANIATNQQINVGAPAPGRTGGRPADSTNELLEAHDGARLDGGAQGAAEGSNRVLAPLGAEQRSPHPGGQGESV